MSPCPDPLNQILMRFRGEGGCGPIVEPVDPDGRRLREVSRRVVQDTLLAAVDIRVVALVAEQPDERAFELVKGGRAIACNPDVSGSAVESVERILYHGIYSRSWATVSTYVYNRQLIHD